MKNLSDQKKAEIEKKSKKIAGRIKGSYRKPKATLRSKLQFLMFLRMQTGEASSWNPTDKSWWVEQGWTKTVRSWRQS